MNKHAHGAFGAHLIKNRNLTPHTNQMSFTPSVDVSEDAGMQPIGDAKTFLQGPRGAAASSSGYAVNDYDFMQREMAHLTGNLRDLELVTFGWFGFDQGMFTTMANTRKTSFNVPVSGASTITTSINHQLDSTYWHGHSLYNPFGTMAYTGGEVQALVFAGADSNQFFALQAAGTTATFAFQAGDSNSALKAGVEALAAYSGVTVTIAGTLTGTGSKTGTKTLTFSGTSDVPQLEVLCGALHTLSLIGATGTKTIYGNVSVDVLASTASSVQADVRAKGSQYANVTVIKSGSGGNAVYTFSYPVSATPAALVQPTLGERHTILGTGNAPVFYGDIAPDLTTATLTSIQTSIRAKTGRSTAVVSGTITAPVVGNRRFYMDTLILGDEDAYTGWYTEDGSQDGHPRYKLDDGHTIIWLPGFAQYAASPGYTGTLIFVMNGDQTDPGTGTWEYGVTVTRGATIGASLGALNLAIQYDLSAGDVGNIEVVPGAGYAGTTVVSGAIPDPQTGAVSAPGGDSTTILGSTLTPGGARQAIWNPITTTGPGVPHDAQFLLPAAQTATQTGFYCRMQVPFALGTSLVVVVEHCDTLNGTYATLHTFTDISDPSNEDLLAQEYSAPAGTSVKRFVRVRIASISGSYAIFVGYARESYDGVISN